MEYSIIGHLHIMLALIAVMITLIIGRWLDFKGILHKIAMPLIILGTIVLNLGVWGVVTPLEPVAHMIIYVGATPAMLGALMLVIFGWDKLIREGVAGIARPTFFQKIGALLRDPLRFGPLWQMVFMNFTVSGLGIFMAVRLDEIFRVWPAREERIELTGHWHVLSAIIATIILLYYGDMIGLKGKAAQAVWLGDHPALRPGLRLRHHLRDEAALRLGSRPAAAGQHGHAADGLRPGDAAGCAGDGDDLAADGPVQEEGPLGRRGRAGRPLDGGAVMRRLSSLLLAITLFLSACGTVDLNAPIPVYETGVDPNAWALVPAGEFLSGQHDRSGRCSTTTTRSWSPT